MLFIPPLPRLPTPPRPSLRWLIRHSEPRIPFHLKQNLLERVLNRIFQQQLSDEEFYFLEHRQLGLEVKDLGISLAFSCQGDKLVVGAADQPDAWIRGNSGDFIQLAGQAEDPDTLFFQRRLSIEGDTELGLAVKNLLDSVDWSEMPTLLQRGLQLMQKLND